MTLEIAIFLSMNGQAKEAINFYTRNLEAKKLMIVTYEELAKEIVLLKLQVKIKIILLTLFYKLGIQS